MAANNDNHGRRIEYLRVSITDRCNLRCVYCMPDGGLDMLEHADILSYEEILRIVGLAARMGITKVRLTGGEPLIRRNVCDLVQRIKAVPGIRSVGLTTNGVRLVDMARPLWEAGLRRINISLDTLNSLKFQKITKRDYFQEVFQGIATAEEEGFAPIKINVVAIRGINDDEIPRFAQWSMEKPYAIRFIEYMPMGHQWERHRSRFLPASKIRRLLETLGRLHPVESSPLDGPSQRFKFESARGEIGLISGLSNHFCHACNRLRLTSDGKLRPCLLSEHEVDVKTPLRQGCSDDVISSLMREAIAMKPKRHGLELSDHERRLRHMSRIGG